MDEQQSGNPYATTAPAESTSTGALGNAAIPAANDAGWVNQVMIVGILQIVLGVMELFMGVVLVFSAFFFSFAMDEIRAENAADAPPEAVLLGMQVYYWIVGTGVLLIALVRIGAGIGSFWFRGRNWMFLSLGGGLLSVLTCYCGIFSIGLAVYGLIVMLQPGVKRAYAMAKDGMSPGEIKSTFTHAAYGYRMAPPAAPRMPPADAFAQNSAAPQQAPGTGPQQGPGTQQGPSPGQAPGPGPARDEDRETDPNSEK